jgi:hypothetical protein
LWVSVETEEAEVDVTVVARVDYGRDEVLRHALVIAEMIVYVDF